jgi:hypothetical protein
MPHQTHSGDPQTEYRDPVPMPALMMAPSCLATTGCLARQAILHADSFPQTDADTSARDCRPSQQDVLDPPDSVRITTSCDSTQMHSNAFGCVLANSPSARELRSIAGCMFAQELLFVNGMGR